MSWSERAWLQVDGVVAEIREHPFVRALHDGRVTGRRGIFARTRIDLGPTAALEIGGIVVVVKSRGHFRGGFDEFFGHDQIVEVDCPGLTSPILERFPWQRLPRPVLPIDADATWSASS